jgi:hypothetical protein
MFVDYDTEVPPARDHPWTVLQGKPDARYWDFRAHPEQIPLALEDFTPWSHYPAIQRFYELLKWLNGSDSVFESNDCGLRPPRQDDAAPEMVRNCFASDPTVVHSRLVIIFRDLAWNSAAPTVDGLKGAIHNCLRDNVPNIPAVVKVGEWKHWFTSTNKEGRAVSLRIWAWGDDEAMAMGHLNSTFDAIHGCLQWISEGVKNPPGKVHS